MPNDFVMMSSANVLRLADDFVTIEVVCNFIITNRVSESHVKVWFVDLQDTYLYIIGDGSNTKIQEEIQETLFNVGLYTETLAQ